MEIIKMERAVKTPHKSPLFTGPDVSMQELLPGSAELRINIVNFGPGVRNKMHYHSTEQVLIVTNSVETRPLTVGLGIFGAPESGVNWSIISAATLISVAPLLIAFLLFQRQFVQSFMYAGIK